MFLTFTQTYIHPFHDTMFENHPKSRIQHCERSELSLYFSGQKLLKNAKMIHLGEFLKTVLPDRSSLKGQKLVKNAKIEKFKCNILSNYQTW